MNCDGVQYQSTLENKRLNVIPDGRQLHRTPPTKTFNIHPTEEPAVDEESSQPGPQDSVSSVQADSTYASVKEERETSVLSCRRSSITSASAKMENADPDALIQGMQGYQWTDADLEFVYQAKQQKQAQQLQQELNEVEKTLQSKTWRLELALASLDQLQSKMSKTPSSCDVQLCKSVLSCSPTADQQEGLGDIALLSLLDLQDDQQSVREENTEIKCLEREVAKTQELRDKEMDSYKQNIIILKSNVDTLKVEIAELKNRLVKIKKASEAARKQREGHRADKAQAISDAPKTPEETYSEEMNTSQVSLVSQVPEKDDRKAKPPTKALKVKVLKEKETDPKEKTGKDRAPKAKAPKKATSKKTANKETSLEDVTQNEMPSQVKTPVEMHKFLNIDEVHGRGPKGSRNANISTKVLKDKALKESAKNEMVPVEMAEKSKTVPKIKATKRTTSKKTAKKKLAVENETPLQVKTPEEMALEETAPEQIPPQVKFLNVAQELEKVCKGLRTAKTSTTAPKDNVLKTTALTDLTEYKMETSDKEMSQKGNKAPKSTTSKNIDKEELAVDEPAYQVKTPEEMATEKMLPKGKSSRMNEVLEGHKGSRMAAPSTTTRKQKGLKRKETVQKEKAQIEVDEKKTARRVKAPKKLNSNNTADKQMASEEASEAKNLDEHVLEKKASKIQLSTSNKTDEMEMVLKEMALKVKGPEEMSLEESTLKVKASKASKRIALKKTSDMDMPTELALKGKLPEEMSLAESTPKVKASKASKKIPLKKTSDMDIPTELTVKGATATNKRTSKVRAPKKMTLKEMANGNAPEEIGLKEGLKEMPKKEMTIKNKVKVETGSEDTASVKNVLKEVDNEETSTKTTHKKTASKFRVPKETALKETISSRRVPKEKEPKQKAKKNPTEDEGSIEAAQVPGKTQKAAEPPKSLLESNHETLRRSKRNTVKNSRLIESVPEKSTCSSWK